MTTYRYDLNSHVTDEIIGEEYHVKYTYNAQNLVESRINSRGQKAEYKYDLSGRVIEQKDGAGTISYTYDANDNVLTVKETVGNAAEAAGAKTTTITRTYDKLNRVTSYDDGRGNTVSYQYDILGNLVTLTYPNGKDVNYTYDKNGNILTMTDWEGRKTAYSYDENGRLVKTARANGTVETRTYDKAGRLTVILDRKGDTETNHQEYTYDSSGNITEVKQLCEGELNFTGAASARMTYDKNNRLLTYNGGEVRYDKDGNMTYGPLAGEMAEFVYDCRNRLVQAGDTKYAYDAENNRIGVETKEKKTTYVINTQPELSQVLQSMETKLSVEDADGGADEDSRTDADSKTDENSGTDADSNTSTTENGNTTITCYFYGNGLTAQDNGKDYFVYHFNNVGSTMAVSDAGGSVVETYHYTPYGELIDGEYREDIAFLYNGQYGVTTDGNGLYYMRARYYNVEIKRFINQDVLLGVLERISSLNRYAYVEGNPISYLDPFGLEPLDTSVAHDVLNITAAIVSVISLIPPLKVVGGIIATIIAGADVMVSIYDLCYAIKNNDSEQIIISSTSIAAGIITAASTAIGVNIESVYQKAINLNWKGAEGFLNKISYVNYMKTEFAKPYESISLATTLGKAIASVVGRMVSF